MKNLTILLMALFAVFFVSCGGGDTEESAEDAVEEQAVNAGMRAQIAAMKAAGATDEEIEEAKKAMEKIGEVAKNIEEMEAEEESDEIFSDANVELLGLTQTERKIPDENWQKAIVLREEWKKLSNEELRGLTKEKIEGIILGAGFTEIESAETSLREIADCYDVITSVSMKIGMLKSTRMLDGKEEYEKEMKALGEKINEREYSAEDLIAMDENVKVSVTATEILYRLDNM
jgi:hypothetical protein